MRSGSRRFASSPLRFRRTSQLGTQTTAVPEQNAETEHGIVESRIQCEVQRVKWRTTYGSPTPDGSTATTARSLQLIIRAHAPLARGFVAESRVKQSVVESQRRSTDSTFRTVKKVAHA